MPKKVFVSGCYDMLHSGHVEFFQQAAAYGDLYVAIGSDATVYELKGRTPVNSQDERRFMVQSVSCVTSAVVATGSGILDFVAELRAIRPDVFVVNEDGAIPQKEALCREEGIEYVVLKRDPHGGLPARSTTDLRTIDQMPYRLDLAGGWLDQPFVSELHPGTVITISLEPSISFNERSGMATSTRNVAIDLWGPKLPPGDPEKLAKILFACDNPPGATEISGSQDAIGIVFAGLNRAHYNGKYWPERIETHHDEEALQFIESALYLAPLGPRASGYDPLADRFITREHARALAVAAEDAWQAILGRDIDGFGGAMRRAFEAQVALFPSMENDLVRELIAQHRDTALGWKLSGAGGGGYLVLVSERPIEHAVRLRIRREME